MPLDHLARSFARYRLPDVLRGLNDAVRRWHAGTLTTSIEPLRRAGSGHPMLEWAVAETARFAILHCARPSSDSTIFPPSTFRGWQTLEPLVHLAVDAHLAAQVGPEEDWERQIHAQPIHNTMGPIWLSQFILQRRSEFRVGQALLLYRDSAQQRAARDPAFSLTGLEGALQRALGVDLEPFLAALLQTYGRSRNQAELSTTLLAPIVQTGYDEIVLEARSDGLLTPEAYTSVFGTLSAAPDEMTRWSAAQLAYRTTSVEAGDAVRGPNPLLQYPIVRCFPDKPDYCIAPVPNLLLEWIYEPLVDSVFARCDSTFGRDQLSALFEEYVGLLAQRCCPTGAPLLPEADLKASMPQGRKVVDWALLARDYVVLIDAKRCYVHPAARYRWLDADWSAAQKEISKGVHQACDFWNAAQSGLVPSIAAAAKPAIALVVTQGDVAFHAARPDWRNTVEQSLPGPTKLPWVVLSLDDYERLMSAWKLHDDGWLHEALLKLASNQIVRDIVGGESYAESSPLRAEFLRFAHKLRDALGMTAPVNRSEA